MKYKQLVQERIERSVQAIDSILNLISKVQISGQETIQRLTKVKQDLNVANGHLDNESDDLDVRVKTPL